MTAEIDVERMIVEIRQRPELWDTSNEKYKDHIKKKESWLEVYRCLFEDFDLKDKNNKRIIEKSVCAKWKIVRDGFSKSKRREKEQNKSGAGRKSFHKYIFADQLAFLEKCRELRETSSCGITEETVVSEIALDAPVLEVECSSADATPTTSNSNISRPRYGQKRKAATNLEENIMNYITLATQQILKTLQTALEPNEGLDFFKSILPMVKNLPMERKLKFRMDVMNDLQVAVRPQTYATNQTKLVNFHTTSSTTISDNASLPLRPNFSLSLSIYSFESPSSTE